MKKMTAIILVTALVFSLIACGNGEKERGSAGIEPSVSENAKKGETGAMLTGSSGNRTESMSEDSGSEKDGTGANRIEEESEDFHHALIVYFSRWGNTDYPENVDASTSASIVLDDGKRYGSTEYIAWLIQQNVGGDLYQIQTAEPYPTDFDEVVDQNHDEKNEGILPELTTDGLDISGYDTVFVGYPVWSSNVPQAVVSFLSQYDLSGKTVIPFCTNDGYGPGNSYSSISQAIPDAAQVYSGLAVEASDVPEASEVVAQWLEEIGMAGSKGAAGKEQAEGTAITITIGDTVLDGVLFDTALADEIQEYFRLL